MTNRNKIFTSYFNGTHSLKDYLKIKEWFRDDNEYKEVEKILVDDWNKIDSSGSLNLPITEIYENTVTKLWQNERGNSKRIQLRNILLRVAAALIIGLVIGVLVTNDFSISEPSYYTVRSQKGSVSQMIMPDGSVVFLNAGSEIKYATNSKNNVREVFLNGEAWFDVEKNEEKPFVVHTPFYNVQVLGTQFNVKAYKEEETITTTLEEGSVLVTSSDNLKLNEDIIIKPGEQLIYNKIKRNIYLKKVETRLYTSWKDNKLIFINTTFEELVRMLERKYGVEIVVLDKSILSEHYTGTIKNETILEILDIIKHTHPILYKIEGQKIIIQKK